ncbi:MAG: hypothetical protein ABI681_08850 [Gemmatimonadales bacterium]
MIRSRVARATVVVGAAVFFAGAAHAQSTGTAPPMAEPTLDTSYVNYDEGPISLPLSIGLRVPSYDRVNGLSVPWGPLIRVPGGRVRIDPTVTFRSNLGDYDPQVIIGASFGHFDRLTITGGRGTFTNDGWIRSDLINSLTSIGVGSDSRNYFRADRGTAVFAHDIPSGALTVTPSIGFLHEFDWSTGFAARHSSAPWSVFGRTDSLKMRRINPAITRGHVTSGLAGVGVVYDAAELTGAFDARLERAFDAPNQPEGYFTQITLGSKVSFPTFGVQSFAFRGHAVITPGDDGAPSQRFAYLGGAGTLVTVDLLALGGDRLLFVEGEYSVPLSRPVLPFVGAPVISARYAAGSAGVGELPSLIQNIGVGVGVKLVKAEYHIDPSYRKTSYTRRSAFSVGFSLSM